MIEVRVPVVAYPDPKLVQPNPLPRSLAGLTLGVLDNQKPHATELLQAIVSGLSQPDPPARVLRETKSPPIPASLQAIDSLAAGADMTIVGSAD
jgi:hypothetical protein